MDARPSSFRRPTSERRSSTSNTSTSGSRGAEQGQDHHSSKSGTGSFRRSTDSLRRSNSSGDLSFKGTKDALSFSTSEVMSRANSFRRSSTNAVLSGADSFRRNGTVLVADLSSKVYEGQRVASTEDFAVEFQGSVAQITWRDTLKELALNIIYPLASCLWILVPLRPASSGYWCNALAEYVVLPFGVIAVLQAFPAWFAAQCEFSIPLKHQVGSCIVGILCNVAFRLLLHVAAGLPYPLPFATFIGWCAAVPPALLYIWFVAVPEDVRSDSEQRKNLLWALVVLIVLMASIICFLLLSVLFEMSRTDGTQFLIAITMIALRYFLKFQASGVVHRYLLKDASVIASTLVVHAYSLIVVFVLPSSGLIAAVAFCLSDIAGNVFLYIRIAGHVDKCLQGCMGHRPSVKPLYLVSAKLGRSTRAHVGPEGPPSERSDGSKVSEASKVSSKVSSKGAEGQMAGEADTPRRAPRRARRRPSVTDSIKMFRDRIAAIVASEDMRLKLHRAQLLAFEELIEVLAPLQFIIIDFFLYFGWNRGVVVGISERGIWGYGVMTEQGYTTGLCLASALLGIEVLLSCLWIRLILWRFKINLLKLVTLTSSKYGGLFRRLLSFTLVSVVALRFEHGGNDLRFQFEWLRENATATAGHRSILADCGSWVQVPAWREAELNLAAGEDFGV